MSRGQALDGGPPAFAIKILRIDRIEVKARDAVTARVALDRRDQPARHALAAEFRRDIKAGKPGGQVTMRRLELAHDEEADAGEPPID